MEYIIGVDGGGTKTTCVLADIEGNIYAQIQNGPSNYHVVGLQAAVEVIHQAVKQLLKNIKSEEQPIKAICLGLAGVDTPSDAALITKEIQQMNIAEHILVVNDTEIALIGGIGDKRGIVVVGGTGSAAFGCDDTGKCAHAGGWGWILGDEGSAFYIGQKGLQAIIRAIEQRGEPTRLVDRLMTQLQLKSVEGLVSFLRARTWTRHDVAKIAEVVTNTALDGDKVAKQIIKNAAEELALLVLSVYRQLTFVGEFYVALSGGVFRSGEVIIKPMRCKVRSFIPQAKLILPRYPSVLGAIFLAREKIGLPIEPERMRMAMSQLLKVNS